MEKIGEEVDYSNRPGLDGKGWRLSSGQRSESPALITDKTPVFLAPSWLKNPPLPETSPQMLRPSEEKDEDVSWGHSDFGAFGTERGILIHKLLETLASLPKERHTAVASRYLEREQVPPDMALEMIESVTRVFDAYPDLFGPHSQGEVPIVGAVGNFVLSGQIDRLVRGEDHILCIDFKTHTHVPEGLDNIPQTYMRQMALYQHALSQIYPEFRILCGILWTHVPRLDLLTDDLLKKFTPSIDEKAS
jgi:ATP-dependent helicase/nuclease subunit A